MPLVIDYKDILIAFYSELLYLFYNQVVTTHNIMQLVVTV